MFQIITTKVKGSLFTNILLEKALYTTLHTL